MLDKNFALFNIDKTNSTSITFRSNVSKSIICEDMVELALLELVWINIYDLDQGCSSDIGKWIIH